MSFSVFEGEDHFVVAAAGGIMAGDSSVLIRHLRQVERTGEVEATVYVKIANKAILEEVAMTTHPIASTRATGNRITEVETVEGQFVRTVIWNSCKPEGEK